MFRKNFETELKQLHQDLIEMGNYVSRAIKDSIRAYNKHDMELCQEIIKNDKIVNEMEKKIESKCLWLIAREQPIASDLRSITTALKIITDMERIGDHAVDIAELAMDLPENSTLTESTKITEMANAAIRMVNNALSAYVNLDLEWAKSAEKEDDVVDEYFNDIKKEITEAFQQGEHNVDNALDILLIAKYLERIADHAVNICEWVMFSQTGEHRNTQIF